MELCTSMSVTNGITLRVTGISGLAGQCQEECGPADCDMMSLLKDVGLWDILAGLGLSRSKAAARPIPASIPLLPLGWPLRFGPLLLCSDVPSAPMNVGLCS